MEESKQDRMTTDTIEQRVDTDLEEVADVPETIEQHLEAEDISLLI